MTTSLTKQIDILTKVIYERDNPEWQPYIAQNYLGLATAYFLFVDEEDRIVSDEEENYVINAFDNLLKYFGILEDTGFDSIDQIMAVAQ
jgi:hypothetical protein